MCRSMVVQIRLSFFDDQDAAAMSSVDFLDFPQGLAVILFMVGSSRQFIVTGKRG